MDSDDGSLGTKTRPKRATRGARKSYAEESEESSEEETKHSGSSGDEWEPVETEEQEATGSPVKKSPGSPSKKSPNKKASTATDKKASKQVKETKKRKLSIDADEQQTAPKKRGRPRKIKTELEDEEPKQKQKGRKRKIAENNTEEKVEGDADIVVKTEAESGEKSKEDAKESLQVAGKKAKKDSTANDKSDAGKNPVKELNESVENEDKKLKKTLKKSVAQKVKTKPKASETEAVTPDKEEKPENKPNDDQQTGENEKDNSSLNSADAKPKPTNSVQQSTSNTSITSKGSDNSVAKFGLSRKKKELGKHFDDLNVTCSWNIVTEVANSVNWDKIGVKNTMHLLDQDNTVPFIARYRKEATRNMDPDKIREVKDRYEELQHVQQKVKSVLEKLNKEEKLTEILIDAFRCCKSLDEVDHLFTPFKTGAKGTLAARARERGLEPYATQLLSAPDEAIALNKAVRPAVKGLENVNAVSVGVKHIIADVISKDVAVLDLIRSLISLNIKLLSTENKSGVQKILEKKQNQNQGGKKAHSNEKDDPSKFEQYFNFTCSISSLKPHQVMAVNRGEDLKILTVKIQIPDFAMTRYLNLCRSKWVKPRTLSENLAVLMAAFDDAYKRLLEPQLVRDIRAKLRKAAEKASVDVFAQNIKRLFLTPPVRGKVVMALDPGFSHGCKYAMLAANGQILSTGVLRLHPSHNNKQEINKLMEIIETYKCEIVAIGNGTACRETEKVMSDCILSGFLRPLDVKYCIVNEAGASIYSASKLAEQELPKLDVSLRGAVSIGRRLQDPMAELVKIEPKHIGVGMYQHDCPEAQLKHELDSVVEECVSFIGVDVNVCSLELLRRVAGMKDNVAKKVLQYREEQSGIKCRQELNAIKGLGPKTYEQCAGFIRILPETAPKMSSDSKTGSAGKKTGKKGDVKYSLNPLDVTSIHPECYEVTTQFLQDIEANVAKTGQPEFIEQIKTTVAGKDIKSLAEEYDVGEPTMKLIIDGLQQAVGHDIREEFDKPLFKAELCSMTSLKPGDTLSGRITNVTHFGAFVDVGVEKDGLIHSSCMTRPLGIGDRVEVRVLNLDFEKKRLGLALNEEPPVEKPPSETEEKHTSNKGPEEKYTTSNKGPQNKQSEKWLDEPKPVQPLIPPVPRNNFRPRTRPPMLRGNFNSGDPRPFFGPPRNRTPTSPPFGASGNFQLNRPPYNANAASGHGHSNMRPLETFKVGEILSGRVKNVVPFGSFLDVGCVRDGLVHKSKAYRPLQVNEHIQVKVVAIDIHKGHLQLAML